MNVEFNQFQTSNIKHNCADSIFQNKNVHSDNNAYSHMDINNYFDSLPKSNTKNNKNNFSKNNKKNSIKIE